MCSLFYIALHLLFGIFISLVKLCYFFYFYFGAFIYFSRSLCFHRFGLYVIATISTAAAAPLPTLLIVLFFFAVCRRASFKHSALAVVVVVVEAP